jgi:hypothetical protein
VRGEYASVAVTLRSSNPHRHVALWINANRETPSLVPEVTYADSTVSNQTAIQKLKPRPSSGTPFHLQWDRSRVRVRLEPNAPWLDVPLGFAVERLTLSCNNSYSLVHVTTLQTPASIVDAQPPPAKESVPESK